MFTVQFTSSLSNTITIRIIFQEFQQQEKQLMITSKKCIQVNDIWVLRLDSFFWGYLAIWGKRGRHTCAFPSD